MTTLSVLLTPFVLLIGTCAWAEPSEFQWESQLKAAIQEQGLDRIIPTELTGCESGDTTKMWVELMKGLSYIESSWDPKNDNKCDLGCDHPSRGLFQMTGSDSALGQNCFSDSRKSSKEPFDPDKNIQCAVKKMKELLQSSGGTQSGSRKLSEPGKSTGTASLFERAGKYWGPFKSGAPANGKAHNLVADVARNCGNIPFQPYILEQGGETARQRASEGAASRGAK